MSEPILWKNILCDEVLESLFPLARSDQFFDALLGDASQGAFDIRLSFDQALNDRLVFEFQLHQRPDHCLRCSLTYGLPNVFARHPIINVNGLVEQLGLLLDGKAKIEGWKLGATVEKSAFLHVVPLILFCGDNQASS